MSTPLTYAGKLNVRPPEKGSFPLDHEGQCKMFMIKYMKCLNTNSNENTKCRQESKDYLECRMENNLMTKEDFSKLGFKKNISEISSEGKE
ncbi:c oxidase assembly COX19 [Octopus vulgaris]|uniref:C oxidase assembly COX19 n=1 Tax=Octopus vulgaris TaxID=6645 RepID=A0AA36AJE5_OCTVU|nr:c oxidase assembly COX19 [Octopus vulgaris]